MKLVIPEGGAIAVVALLALSAGNLSWSQVDTRVTRITHFEDSSSDRTPSVTAVPQYPKVARRDRIEGEATVCYFIDAKGRVRKPSVRSSSHRMFERPSMRAIKQSSYEPIEPDKKVSQVKTCRTYRFLLTPVAIEAVE